MKSRQRTSHQASGEKAESTRGVTASCSQSHKGGDQEPGPHPAFSALKESKSEDFEESKSVWDWQAAARTHFVQLLASLQWCTFVLQELIPLRRQHYLW